MVHIIECKANPSSSSSISTARNSMNETTSKSFGVNLKWLSACNSIWTKWNELNIISVHINCCVRGFLLRLFKVIIQIWASAWNALAELSCPIHTKYPPTQSSYFGHLLHRGHEIHSPNERRRGRERERERDFSISSLLQQISLICFPYGKKRKSLPRFISERARIQFGIHRPTNPHTHIRHILRLNGTGKATHSHSVPIKFSTQSQMRTNTQKQLTAHNYY